ncbi:MAG: hypothetical protein JWR75_1869 [Devosia sp.]|nr:hypothetical protein [Devosia sp.]
MTEPSWINQPPVWHEADGVLEVETGKETDWWNNTFYGFLHDTGHFRAEPATGDFTYSLSFSAAYETLFDQAGAMVYVDARNWLKAGIEFADGRMNFSVVVTRDDQSDWSVMQLPPDTAPTVTLRLSRHGESLRIERLAPDGTWWLARLAYLTMPDTVSIGPMCCSPVGEGLKVRFENMTLAPAIPRELHGVG